MSGRQARLGKSLPARVDLIVQISSGQGPVRPEVVVRAPELLARVERVRDCGQIAMGAGNVWGRPERQQLHRIRVALLWRDILWTRGIGQPRRIRSASLRR